MSGDLISRQALMKEFSDFVRKSNNSDFAPTPTWNDAVSLVESMPSAERRGRWIPVTERLPEEYGRYLVTFEDEGYRSVMPLYYGRIGRISTFYDSDSEWGDVAYDDVIAWMELPEPYKTDSNTTQHTECRVKLYKETKLRFVLDEYIKDEELIETILKAMDEVDE